MRRAAILGAVFGMILAAQLQAAPPAAQPEPGLLARWPDKSDIDEQVFDGQFLPLPPANTGTGPFTVSVWVLPTDLAGGNAQYGRGILRSTRNDQVGDWLLAVHPDGRLRFCNWRKPGEQPGNGCLTTKPAVKANAWHHIVASWDGKANHLFVNGVEFTHGNIATGAGWGAGHEVGRSWTAADYYWAGTIDDVRIYNRPLNTDDVKKLHQGGPPKPTQKVVKAAGDAKVSEALDKIILTRLQQEKIVVAPPADDAEFLRRVTLDLTGRIPTPGEVEAFLSDKAADKRVKMIEVLLAGREMPFAWSQILSGWLMPKEGKRDGNFLGYLRNGLAKNKTWDRFAREMLTARFDAPSDQGANLFLSYRKPALADKSIARDVGRAFFGVNLRCAQCHDHPHVPKWTNDRFYGLSAFYARTYEAAYVEAGNQKKTMFAEKTSGELEYTSAGKKKTARLMFLDSREVAEPSLPKDFKEPAPPKVGPPPEPKFSRRDALMRVALAAESPYFKRAIVNRVWQRLTGRGLVEPVDMMHDGNPATHPELLDLLANDFEAHGYDLRRLIAVIMQSETYARSSRWPGKGDLPKETLYAVAILKPLDADQMALSLPLATGYYDGQLKGDPKRALANVRSSPWKEVLAEFDTESDDFEPTAAQALFLTNSNYVQSNFVAKSNLVQSLSAMTDDAALARRAYLAVLSRLPTAEETAEVGKYLGERGVKARADACREVVWALISGAEFRFCH